jgi:ATP-dependent RNA helicase DDX41
MSSSYQPYLTPAQRKRLHSQRGPQTTTTTTTTNIQPIESTHNEISNTNTTNRTTSLVEQVRKMKRDDEQNPEEAARRKREEEEARVLESVKLATAQALVSTREKKGDPSIHRTSPIRGWKPSSTSSTLSTIQTMEELRKQYNVKVETKNNYTIPDMLCSFAEMNLPPIIHACLERKNIASPTAIQMQGLPVILSGRDAILVASTGSGKTLTFAIPAVVACLEQLTILQQNKQVGPLVLCLGPSRELQRQTYEVIVDVAGNSGVTCSLAIGGEDVMEQLKGHRERGGYTHILVGTPGRVKQFMHSGDFSMSMCNMLILDEGDRMLDVGFDEEVRQIMGRAIDCRQTILFSATMPRKVVDFAMEAMLDSTVIVNVGRAGIASATITQKFKEVKYDDRFLTLLDILKKTGPPVLIFASRSGDVDDVEEYLLLKGVRAVGIHGGRSQEERNSAVDRFKSGEKDVLVASDVAAKGLDFPMIKHVINFDTPSDVETYVHRIGRTGRGGNKGLATTCVVDKFVMGNQTFFMDVIALLIESKQEIPEFFKKMGIVIPQQQQQQQNSSSSSSTTAADGNKACGACGGWGHSTIFCPQLQIMAKKIGGQRDLVSGSNF